jgi:hypothetical protein
MPCHEEEEEDVYTNATFSSTSFYSHTHYPLADSASLAILRSLFLVLGTSTGRLLVVECNDELRIVDYVITPTDLGMGGAGVSYWVADLRICPKDDKYIAVGYCDHADEMKGERATSVHEIW